MPVFAKYMKQEIPIEKKQEERPKQLDFKYLNSDLKGDEVEIAGEWMNKLMVWFAHLRVKILSNCSKHEMSVNSIIRSIESGDDPNLSEFGMTESLSGILEYLSKDREALFTKCELTWVFSILILIDRLPNDEIANLLEKVLARIDNQILKTPQSDSLYPFLVVCHALLSKFFHRM